MFEKRGWIALISMKFKFKIEKNKKEKEKVIRMVVEKHYKHENWSLKKEKKQEHSDGDSKESIISRIYGTKSLMMVTQNN